MFNPIPVIYLNFDPDAPADNYWDMEMIKDIFREQDGWTPSIAYTFRSYKYGEEDIPPYDGAIFVIPARQNAANLLKVQAMINDASWCLLILTGDEERSFDYTQLVHNNMKVWLMQPKKEDEADFFIGSGYTPFTRKGLMSDKAHQNYVMKSIDWSFAGQINHIRREIAFTVLNRMTQRTDINHELLPTEGFAQGIDPIMYAELLAETKAVPAPSGIMSPDSFRLYEALEAGAVPVADEIAQLWGWPGYWNKVFNEEDVPFKRYAEVENLEGYITDVIREYPSMNNKVYAWWQGYKRRMAYTLNEHVAQLSGIEPKTDFSQLNQITVLVTSSPIRSHPSTEIIEKTITDIRKVLPYAEIIIGIDGVREEQTDYKERYDQYISRLLWLTNFQWHNVLPVVFEEHKHQAAMTRELLKKVHTPTILFVEHDTALAPDFDYDWESLVKTITDGEAYTIRFHHEAAIPEEHNYLMIGDREIVNGVPLLKTVQWSQRPHLSSTVFYRDMMERYFTDESRTMIEDKVHGYPAEAYRQDGVMGWHQWRIWIYYPEGKNIKRSYTTDGRGDDPKYEMRF